ncbi:MAG: hypothetical protein BWY02_01960 [bacterium ADurb.Bin157]|nr:MAG: hypothetical protein BWY02_01960 [bacterium ADurb.Bin157]
MDHIIITCDPDNIASSKTCKLAGGKFLEIAPIPEDNEMYNPETPDKCTKVYKVLL